MRTFALLALFACHTAHVETAPKLHEGVTIAVYDSFSVVDDRRAVDTQGGALVLDKIDPGASLASMVIESDLAVGACRREMAVASSVRCEVTGAPGHHVVRVLYVSTALHYRADHEVSLTTPGAAHVVSRYAVDTPAWGGRAELILYDGAPGGDRIPREVARGAATLDGTTAVLATPPRDVPATLRRVYDGALLGGVPATDAAWGHDSQPAVWVWLELSGLVLAPGPLRVHVELAGEPLRDVIVPAEGRQSDPANPLAATAQSKGRQTDHGLLRAALWVDTDLRGSRTRSMDLGEGSALAERLLLGVANSGPVPREVWIEEHLRPARRRHVERAWPAPPIVTGDLVKTRVVVKPGGFERTAYTIAYDY